MKLRIKGDSIRFRVTPSELAKLMNEQTITEELHISREPELSLRYSVHLTTIVENPSIAFSGRELSLHLPLQAARQWAESHQVGIQVQKFLDENSTLTVLIEKDFACLDLSDEENADTFPNPSAGLVC